MTTVVPVPRSLVAELGLDAPGAGVLGELLAGATVGHAERGADGRLRAAVHIREDGPRCDPSVLVVPHGGEVDLDFYNDDTTAHGLLVPSNGDDRWVWLPVGSHGRATVDLDGPGTYRYGSDLGRDEGRGLAAAIVVRREDPREAALDGPS